MGIVSGDSRDVFDKSLQASITLIPPTQATNRRVERLDLRIEARDLDDTFVTFATESLLL